MKDNGNLPKIGERIWLRNNRNRCFHFKRAKVIQLLGSRMTEVEQDSVRYTFINKDHIKPQQIQKPLILEKILNLKVVINEGINSKEGGCN